ncbi:MAG: Alkanal monooxygenase alpha chain [Alphaproteobacteria bacterium MarineAlpha10_Bin3]|jgi:alkanesulfonate monooxygenase SsuD/methylene tetrahydromethanopterin reductase-like flavin-dependent oxidoreductase (luciferase family)|nr:MAG: Alkanal monooxygenase alpha chain [Alphaproteobacteria bacterium MarineAlpha10_Bin3]PPR72579.1 MAG: Alkanal monooxygenase alpha chain [Alphaproteobacteria bacterium MarineAlpha4_Bin1]
MIEKYSSLFAGHIDLGEVGQDTTPANERRYSDVELAGVFAKCEAMAKVMDDCGYGTLWFAEHHFQREGYECIPNNLMMGVHLAHMTKTLKIGCGFNITPMWHPLRLAEDYAMADWLTKGRVIFGVGRGYHTREVETLGGPLIDKEANRDVFEEQVDIMFKAFNQAEFSHKGKYYELPPKLPYRGYELSELTLVPRPWKLPVECWQPVVSAQDRGLDFMVKHGIKGIVGGGSALMAEGNIHAFQRAHERAGIDTKLGENLCLGITYHLAPTREQAIREATPYYEEHAKMFGPLGFLGPLKPEQIEAIGRRGGIRKSGIPTLKEAFEAGSWYCGPPEGFVEFLQQTEEKFPGLEIVNVQSAMGTPEAVILEQLEWFAGDVMSKMNRAEAAD